MIAEDALNFQAQLEHLFRVFECDVDVTLHHKGDDYGVNVISHDAQVDTNSKTPKKAKRG